MTRRDPVRRQFSARLDGELDGNAARAFDQALDAHPDLADEYRAFAEVIHLLNVLPRPEPDDDFALKVQRRIRRRQRGRRRARTSHATAPALGTLGTAVALLVVAGVGLLTHPLQTPLSAPASSGLAASGASTELVAHLELPPAAVVQILDELAQRGAVTTWQRGDAPGAFTVVVAASELALTLDLLGSGTPLRIGAAARPADPRHSVLHIVVRRPG